MTTSLLEARTTVRGADPTDRAGAHRKKVAASVRSHQVAFPDKSTCTISSSGGPDVCASLKTGGATCATDEECLSNDCEETKCHAETFCTSFVIRDL
jgi:hypothetical protein